MNGSMKRFLKTREKLIFDSSNFFVVKTNLLEPNQREALCKIMNVDDKDLKESYIFPRRSETYIKPKEENNEK